MANKKKYTKNEKKSFFNGLRFGIKKKDKARKYLKRKESQYKPYGNIKFDKNGEPIGDVYSVIYADQQQTLKNIGYYDLDDKSKKENKNKWK